MDWHAKLYALCNILSRCSTLTFHCSYVLSCFFISDTVNVTDGEGEERILMTGLHTVADIFYVGCGSILGWKYETAHEKSQKYKEGKSILERLVDNCFDESKKEIFSMKPTLE
ncbi:hypothetical protein LOK49_LG11G00780 [Camellia lanceoleosa]|uniref:Uncharacterized protein n=1 Tax=Camellia lanceoleosa TaxID=1840588 RepID=A0ACC0FZ93_9ERIC|nr:hypothetical protein LOK49_LG11G00780 [Camellia lanceoleosa]